MGMVEPGLSRAVYLPVVPNARHLGGLPSALGEISFRNVIRSGTLAGLLPEAIDMLETVGVRAVVDLRTAEERNISPEPDLAPLGLRHVWAPVVERDPAPLGVNLECGHAGFVWMYQNFLEYGRKAMAQLIQVIAEADGGVLYHCSAGEDRTGVATAVLLSLLRVPEEVIIQDHAQSVTVESLAARGITGEKAVQRATAPLRAMAATLELIRERWGAAEGYLLEAGTSHAAIDAVRARARARAS
jgi:protein-tyrosine phosphatase